MLTVSRKVYFVFDAQENPMYSPSSSPQRLRLAGLPKHVPAFISEKIISFQQEKVKITADLARRQREQ